MKERMIGPTAPEARVSQPALTRPASSTYPRRGEQNMPDRGHGEIPMNKVDITPASRQEATVNRASVPSSTVSQEAKSPQQNEGPRKPVSAERVAQARAAWEEANKGKALSVDERRTQEMMIERGYPPMPGGADTIVDAYGDPILQGIADDLNDEVDRVNPGGEDRPLNERFIQRNIERVQQLADSGAVNRNEARQLLRTLNEWSGEAEAAREAARAAAEAARMAERRRGGEDYAPLANRAADLRRRAAPASDPERAQLILDIDAVIESAPSIEAHEFPEDLLTIAAEFKETREKLISRLIFRPYETSETERYRINMLYGEPRLERLIEATRNDTVGFATPEGARARYHELLLMKSAAESFHSMNATIVSGNIEQFIRGAEVIVWQHFNVMQRIEGVGEVMRLYEQKFQEELARSKWVSTAGYQRIRQEVEEAMRSLNERGLLQSDFANERIGTDANQLKQWELERAINAGRAFFNITFRAAEKIGTGQVPRPGMQGERQYASFPQESAARMMNFVQLMLFRFGVGTGRGGMEFLDLFKKKYLEHMRDIERAKLGINSITELGGMNVEEMEMGGMLGVSGVYSGWRMENFAFPAIPITINGVSTNLRQWFDANRTIIDQAKEIREKDVHSPAYAREVAQKQQDLERVLAPLIDNLDMGMGMFVKHGDFAGEVGYRARVRLWQRIAGKNNLLMASYLRGLKIRGNGVRPLEQILGEQDAHLWGVQNPQGVWEFVDNGSTQWQDLQRKIQYHHERDLKLALEGPTRVGLVPVDMQYSIAENAILARIRVEGRALAPHLADISFPQTPFLNDLPFEALDAGGPGEEFFRRRIGGDIPSYFGAEQGLLHIQDNPGGLGTEKALEELKKIESGISGPNGPPDGTRKAAPIFEAWLEISMARPGERQMILKAIKQEFGQATSLAEEWAGIEADSFDESQARKVVEDAHKLGILSHSLAHEVKKRKHLTWQWLVMAIFRDLFWLPVAVGIKEFVGQTTGGMLKAA